MLKDNNMGNIPIAPSKLTFEDDDLCGWLSSFSKNDKTFIAKIRKAQSDQPKVKARNFSVFSSRIARVEYSNEAGKCCIRGHDVDAIHLPEFLRKISGDSIFKPRLDVEQ